MIIARVGAVPTAITRPVARQPLHQWRGAGRVHPQRAWSEGCAALDAREPGDLCSPLRRRQPDCRVRVGCRRADLNAAPRIHLDERHGRRRGRSRVLLFERTTSAGRTLRQTRAERRSGGRPLLSALTSPSAPLHATLLSPIAPIRTRPQLELNGRLPKDTLSFQLRFIKYINVLGIIRNWIGCLFTSNKQYRFIQFPANESRFWINAKALKLPANHFT